MFWINSNSGSYWLTLKDFSVWKLSMHGLSEWVVSTKIFQSCWKQLEPRINHCHSWPAWISRKLNVTKANLTVVIRFGKAAGLYEPLNSDISKKINKEKKTKTNQNKAPSFYSSEEYFLKVWCNCFLLVIYLLNSKPVFPGTLETTNIKEIMKCFCE